ncbi:MAG: hypothetical protein M0P69_11920, partial [Bacteroidales bacterium]|nr:hypothetical protein [Bacteroidales bacterium]
EAHKVAKKIRKARLREVAERLGIEINDKKDTVNTLRDRIVEVISGEREAQTPDVGTEQGTTEIPTQAPVVGETTQDQTDPEFPEIDDLKNADDEKEAGKRAKSIRKPRLVAVAERLGLQVDKKKDTVNTLRKRIVDAIYGRSEDSDVESAPAQAQPTANENVSVAETTDQRESDPVQEPAQGQDDSFDPEPVINQLRKTTSRKEARDIIKGLTKKQAITVSEKLGITRDDWDMRSPETIKDSIMDETVGTAVEENTVTDDQISDLREKAKNAGGKISVLDGKSMDELKAIGRKLGLDIDTSSPMVPVKRSIVNSLLGHDASPRYRASDAFEVSEEGKDRTTEFEDETETSEKSVSDDKSEKTQDQDVKSTTPKSEPVKEQAKEHPEEKDVKGEDKSASKGTVDFNKRITFKFLKKAFPKEKVYNLGKGLFKIIGRNGKTAYVALVKRIDIDPVAFKKANKRLPTPEEMARGGVGSSELLIDGTSLIQIAADMTMTAENINERFKLKDSATGEVFETTRGTEMARTIFHESYHTASDMVLSKKEKALLTEKYGSEEAQADAYMDWLLNRESKSTVGRIFQRIYDFFSTVRSGILGPNSESVFVNINRGNAWSRESGAKKGDTSYRIQGSLRLDDESLSKKDVETLKLIDDYFDWKPPTKGEKDAKVYLGAPEWIKTETDIEILRKDLRQLLDEGVDARFWYEESGESIFKYFGLNGKQAREAAKFVQVLAIFSPNSDVEQNTGSGIKAWEQYKRGVPESEFHVGMPIQDAKAIQVLYHDALDFDGRKTSSFYENLMYIVLKDNAALAKEFNIDIDLLKATVDLWVYRAFGYKIVQGGNDKGSGKYSFCENHIRQLTAELNRERKPGEPIWTPHQVQAAIWTAIKTRWESAITREAVANGNKERSKGKLSPLNEVEIRNLAMTVPDTEHTKAEVSKRKASFADYLKQSAFAVTWEAIPSESIGAEINNASVEVKRDFTQKALSLLLDKDGNDILAKKLGIEIGIHNLSSGAYAGGVNPNVITEAMLTRIPEIGINKKTGELEIKQGYNHHFDLIRSYARAIQYIMKQNAVPWSLPRHLPFASKSAIEANKFRVVGKKADGSQTNATRFESLSEAREFAEAQNKKVADAERKRLAILKKKMDKEGKTFVEKDHAQKVTEYSVFGGNYARATKFSFTKDLTDNDLVSILNVLTDSLGEDTGFTQLNSRELVVVNFRSDDTKIPFGFDDDSFLDIIEKSESDLKAIGLADKGIGKYWTESEYGPVHDWEADPEGGDILDQGTASRRSDIQQWCADRRKDFEGLLKEYSGENLRNLEGTINNRGGVRGSGPEDSTGKGTKYRVGVATQTTELPFTVEPDGSVRLFHWGKDSGLTTLDPKHHGSGISGAERKRRDNNSLAYVSRIYYGVNGGGYVKEPRLSNNKYETSVKLEELYDFTSDPEGFLEKGYEKAGPYAHDDAITYAERLISEAGYNGLWVNTRRDQNRVVAILFTPTEVKSVPYSEESLPSEEGTPKYRISDRDYLSAVEAGDMETAQRMVDEAAKEAGYGIGPVYHGTNAKFNTFRRGDIGFHFGTKSQARSKSGYGKDAVVISANLNIQNPLRISTDYGSWDADYAAQWMLKDGHITQDEYREIMGAPSHKQNKTMVEVLIRKGYDGIEYMNHYEGRTLKPSYIVFSSSQVKRTDPITRDHTGNVIPLSERFDSKKPDIRYRISDRDYLSAVEAGDMETAQRMVDEAAKEAGYGIGPVVHGSFRNFNEFKRNRLGVNTFGNANYPDVAASSLLGHWFNSGEIVKSKTAPYNNYRSFYLKTSEMLEFDDLDELFGTMHSMVGDFDPDDYEGIEPEVTAYVKELVEDGYDGIKINDDTEFGGISYVVFDSEQIKSADPIVKDDKGNVIPLSERFDSKNPDIRYRVSFHGTRAKFDRPSMAHVGSGLGENKYGWGLYVTHDESYADALKRGMVWGQSTISMSNGEYRKRKVSGIGDVWTFTPAGSSDTQDIDRRSTKGETLALIDEYMQSIGDEKFDPDKLIEEVSYILGNRRLKEGSKLNYYFSRNRMDFGSMESQMLYRGVMRELRGMPLKSIVRKDSEAYKYTMEIPEADVMLNWGVPLSEQPKPMIDALNSMDDDTKSAIGIGDGLVSKMTGEPMRVEELIDTLDEHTGSSRATSLYLNSLGIEGIDYGTRDKASQGRLVINSVIFNAEAIKNVGIKYRLKGGMSQSSHPITAESIRKNMPGMKVYDFRDGIAVIGLWNGNYIAVDTEREIPTGSNLSFSDIGPRIKYDSVNTDQIHVIDGNKFVSMVDGISRDGVMTDEAFEFARDMILKENESARLDKKYGSIENQKAMYRKFLGMESYNPEGINEVFIKMREYFTSLRNKMFGKNSSDVVKKIALEGRGEEQSLTKSLIEEWKTMLVKDANDFRDKVKEFIRNGGKGTKPITMMVTPVSMWMAQRQIGIRDPKFLPITIEADKLRKILFEKHSDQISEYILSEVPKALAEPMMILRETATENGKKLDDLTFVLMLKDKNGSTVNVILGLNKTMMDDGGTESYIVNYIKSVYARSRESTFRPTSEPIANNQWYLEQANSGRLLYIDTDMARMWGDLSGLKEGVDSLISREVDEEGRALTQYDLEDTRTYNQNGARYRVASKAKQSDAWKNITNAYNLEEVVDPTRAGQTLKERISSAWKWWKREMIDDISGIKEHFGKDIYIRTTNAIHGINSRAEALIRFGEKGKGVKGLYEIFDTMPVDEQDGFMHYAVYKHLQDIAENTDHAIASVTYLEGLADDERKIARDYRKKMPLDPKDKSNLEHNAKLHETLADEYQAQADMARKQIHETRAKADDYKNAIAGLEKQYPHWKNAQKDLAKYSRYLLWKLQKSGIISKNLYDVLVSRYPNYIPLQRDFGEEGAMESFSSSRGIVNLTSPIKKLKGSRRDVKDPLFQIVSNTYAFEGLIGKQNAAVKIAEMADQGQLAGLVDPTDDRRGTPGEYVFHVWEDGKKKFYKTDQDIYTALVMSSRDAGFGGGIDVVLKILSIPVRVLRAGVTHGVGFILRNP